MRPLVALIAFLALASPASASAARLEVHDSAYGRILTDGRGLTLYLFTHDGKQGSRCDGACAEAWPPLLTDSTPAAGKGARARWIGTTRRADGTRQATYRGHPLYFYYAEDEPGEIFCQDVIEFGGTWLLVSPQGAAIR